ncbi:hypothetical protein N7462_007668 [Penicillium macrosclerotiorum]|uniref:uncharacterized protein n=1 Tax=Penicillium macrosclerotiorum TaxID=303699 RepID=UPI0025494032|nr:uncharacterized protein N7462_007668 [Penicillium macrosclerotiorum]KAJ5679424.1 hypothetical protein N7462_007668 [Penicillium macrosclerotiorum]
MNTTLSIISIERTEASINQLNLPFDDDESAALFRAFTNQDWEGLGPNSGLHNNNTSDEAGTIKLLNDVDRTLSPLPFITLDISDHEISMHTNTNSDGSRSTTELPESTTDTDSVIERSQAKSSTPPTPKVPTPPSTPGPPCLGVPSAASPSISYSRPMHGCLEQSSYLTTGFQAPGLAQIFGFPVPAPMHNVTEYPGQPPIFHPLVYPPPPPNYHLMEYYGQFSPYNQIMYPPVGFPPVQFYPTIPPAVSPPRVPTQPCRPAPPKRTFEFIDPTVPADFVANPNNHGRWQYDQNGNRHYLNAPKNKKPRVRAE